MLPLEKNYSPTEVETKWRDRGSKMETEGTAPEGEGQGFCILMPPPNVTGILHMGHMLNQLVQDVLIRWARLQGRSTLWIPGTDHAGLATQIKVERALKKENLTPMDLGRENFLRRAHQWQNQNGGTILKQMERLGISPDWNRYVYTLDEGYSRAVQTAFVKLYEGGYLYRGTRLVHWCPVSRTALSDEEVVMKRVNGRLYTFRYPLAEEEGFLPVATTRPETIPGDVALAVNPSDERYAKFVGKRCRVPFSGRVVPILADEVVDKAFGTGVVKITPAHDPVDFEVGQRHRLPSVNVFNDDATLNVNGKPFEGLDRTVAREAVVEALRREGRLIKVEEYTHAVGYSERADVPVEPRLSRQWFLRYPKVSEARRAVVNGAITFWPKRWEKTYLYWLDHLKDWCISRQLWWGHRLPVWYRKGHEEEIHVSLEGPSDPENWEQDPDVVDTWFSSWLWPFATFGWPDKAKMDQNCFDAYFPTQVLVTGPDILFFWVARMVMASVEFLEDRPMEDRWPFRHVYLTGIVRDAGGRKMSKSLGNSPDPIDLMDRYGTDGVRLGLLSIAPQGQDICFDEKFLEQGRNFCTKLWNACRFRQMQGGETQPPKEVLAALPMVERTPYDESILYALKMAMDGFSSHLERFELNGALKCLMSFFRNDFCDGYLEFLKYSRSEASPGIQDLCLHYVLKRLYPMAPFITEELWERMELGPAPLSASRLEEEDWDRYVKNEVEGMRPVWEEVERLKTVVSEVRFLKAEWGLAAQKTVCMKVFLREEGKKFFQRYGDMLRWLAGLESLESIASTDGVDGHPVKVTSVGSFYLGLGKSLDVAEEIRRLEGEKQLYEKYIASADKRLADETFCSRAPAEVWEATRRQRDENEVKWKEISRRLERLKKVSESPLGE